MIMADDVSGTEIRELRKRLGLTQEEFAHAVAVTFSTVNRWENGHAKPSKLARRALETLADSLHGGATPASFEGLLDLSVGSPKSH